MNAAHHRRATGIAAAFAIAAISLAGCGGSASPVVPSLSGSRQAAQAAEQSEAQLLHSAGQCIRSHGIPGFPDPTISGSGLGIDKSQLLAVSRAALNNALTACRTELARAGFEAGRLHPTSVTPAQMAQILAFARCVRAHGIPNFPDPAPGTGEITLPPGTAKDSPVLQAADRACQHYLPGVGK
jgi:hypothetical protein